MTYNPAEIAALFDQEGAKEWERLVATPVDEISLYLHAHYLRRFIVPGSRVLEIGAGAGRFTQILAEIGARVLVADLSPVQLKLNRQFAARLGFAPAVEDWQVVDITDLSRYGEASFDYVVAYGGPFSYVLDRRDQALAECARVLRPGGRLLASVMSLWGSACRALPGTLDVPPEYNQKIAATGDLTASNFPARQVNPMHLFRVEETRAWVDRSDLHPLAFSASGVLALAWGDHLSPIRQDPARWNELLRMELDACADPACLGMGTHLIFAAEKV